MPSTRIALAGATGNLGTPILKALLDADLSVTVLSRRGGNASKLTHHPNLDIKEVDFNSIESLRPALLGVEVVVSCVQADVDGAMLGFCFCGSLCRDYGCDFSGRLDNEMLGIKELGEDELRALVASFL
ncbi:oxidoreductase-like protein [Colletotrichum tofieldiae]|uniref:Oxidoreductase-like protein n=1 Tax=Colletotrichum tofieldiae TaxID=708197 RepID=A0A166N3R4_9PEZI|nr:oxidoreductase-like protein [Colletotrichum tofieldiae]